MSWTSSCCSSASQYVGFDPVLLLEAAWKPLGDRTIKAEDLEALLKV